MKKKMKQKQKEQMNSNDPKQQDILANLDKLIDIMKDLYHLPVNQDVTVRELIIGGIQKRGCLFSINSITNKKEIQENIIQPLIENQKKTMEIEDIVTLSSLQRVQTINDAVSEINNGNTVLFVNGVTFAYVFESPDFKSRSVERSQNEITFKGPKEAFTESVMTNINMIRKKFKNENLIFEDMTISVRANNQLYISYVKDLVNEDLLQNIKKRIQKLDPATLQTNSILEEYIDEYPYSIFPTFLYTERPDRAVAYLSEGHIVILMENSPDCLIMPVTFWDFIHSPDDQYLKMLYGNFIRVLRAISIFITLFTSSAYIAVTTFHASMIPPDLLLAIASTREKVPFPAFFEVLIMEISFEMIREAALRVPAPIGATIGIVGALILGQAAVQANIVSPIVVIVVALSGLSSFVINDIGMGMSFRLARLALIMSAGLFGMYGMAALFVAGLFYLVSLKPFGIPYLAPYTPRYGSSGNILFRKLIKKEKLRPEYLKPKDLTKK